MTCEVCGSPTTDDGHAEKPAGESYFTATFKDEEALSEFVTYRFCSVEHLRMFTAPVSDESSEVSA